MAEKKIRPELLAAVPVKNELVRESRRTEKSLRLTAPLRKTALSRLFKPTAAAATKSFDLDPLGIWVWDHLDGVASITALIEHFSAAHQMAHDQAQPPILAFLQTLARRNLVALVAPKGPD